MSLFDYLRRKNSSAAVAKDRLKIIISHERSQRNKPDYLPKLPIDREQVNVNLERMGTSAVLELNITMPEEALEKT
jgi:cell division topological specificity factor